jgi:hypothetical protein
MIIMKRAVTVVCCMTAILSASAAGALAGEVTGPPGTASNPNTTSAL